MSKAELDAFFAKAVTDEALLSLMASSVDLDTFIDRVAETAKQAGYTFSRDELAEHLKQSESNQELTDKELDAVAGGYLSYGNSILCGFCGPQSGTCSLTILAKK